MRRGVAPRTGPALAFLAFLALAAAAGVLLLGRDLASLDETRVLMDTFVTVRVRATTRDAARRALDAAFAEMARVSSALDWFDPTKGAGPELPTHDGGAGAADEDLARAVAAALDVARASDGAYDPTVRPLSALWRFDASPRVPPADSIAAALARVDFRRVRVERGRVLADAPGMRLDLGGVAKGCAVDRAIALLRTAPGVRAALVAASGDIQAFGPGPRRGGWTIGIAHPRAPGAVAGRFTMREGCVSTSGDSEQAFVEAGVRYHHILDPRTGYPARRCVSVTLFAPAGASAETDALATALFVLGPEEGRRLLASRPGRDAIWIVERDGGLAAESTPGVTGRIELHLAPAGPAP
jgi:thiamine biosynthesis lipoprotein